MTIHHQVRSKWMVKFKLCIQKNWLSLMVFNCSHQDCHRLTLENVNHQTPKYLHRFEWCDDQNLGSVPLGYNYLVGYYDSGDLKALHFTDGGP